MEHHESAAEQKCNKETGEKSILQRKWVSEPSPNNRLFSDLDGKDQSGLEGLQGGVSGSKSTSLGLKYHPEKRLSSAMSRSSENNQCPQVNPASYSQKLPHSYPQQLMQKSVLPGTKPQPSPETRTWQLKCPSSDDMFLEHIHSQGVFPQQKSPSSPVVFLQYSQPGSEQYEEIHKKELKPKKPGRYVCNYCGRACAKPSVLKKHIRSHTGERPYPCGPCGFSFKTKSNLYKHRKSHAHAIKAGLVPFSEQVATRADMDQASLVGEADIHSDVEQSTDTEEETTEGLLFQDNICQIPQISFESESSTMEMIGQPTYVDSADESSVASMKVPILIIPKQGIPSTSMECTDSQAVQGDESHAIKQRFALRLTEKKGQDSEQSLNLLSPHSKGSTDSGYFSRSESAEQQISPPNTNAKSYEEIMFGRYYRPNARLRQSITVGMATGQDNTIISMHESDAMLDVGMRSLEHRLLTDDSSDLQMVPRCDIQVYATDPYHNSSLLEAPSDSGPLMRSNSMPTSSLTNLSVPPGLRVSHSFDEMMTPDDVFYPGAASLRRLRRQAAFEHSAHEGHADSENIGVLAKNTVPPLKYWDKGNLIQDFRSSRKECVPDMERTPFVSHTYRVENTTRKRRKEKSVGDEEDSVGHYDNSNSGCVEIVGDYDPNMGQDVSRGTSTGKWSMCSSHSQSDSFDNVAGISSDVIISDLDRKATGNVISVIQHTNSLSRPSSFENSDSIDLPSYQDKPNRKLSEHSDTENIEDGKKPEFALRSESKEWQQQSDGELVGLSPNQQYHMPHKLVRQPNIQVPEIRVTEEPDKPEREPEAAAKEPEKQHIEEFQWPQRSETLSQLPAEKLPPKKKRLRLADMEYSSGESSFESTCTSLSRSPSQDSNLSHSSSFSMSFEKEENIKCMSPTKLEDLCKQSEFLTVPGSGYSLSIPGHHNREMRRSSSEQAPCTLPAEVPEIRSKSFDYGSLSTTSRQGELYASPSSLKERRRGYLVRQASLSVYPDTALQEQNVETSMKQEHSEIAPHLSSLGWHSSSLTTSHGTTTSEEPKSKRAQGSSDCENSTKESKHKEALHPSLSPKFQYWDSFTQRQQHSLSSSKHHLPKVRVRHPSFLPVHQQLPQTLHQEHCDSETDRGCSQRYLHHLQSHSSQTPSISSDSPQHPQPVVSTLNVRSESSFPGMLVPVRIQTHVPSYSSIMYTSVSEIMATHAQCTTSRVISTENTLPISLSGIASKHETGVHLSHIFGYPHPSVQYPILTIPESLSGRLNTGIPLSLTSGTMSTTDASSGIGASKRMLSPASSLELFIETKQQKRVKEERMYGQIVKELSAVELSNTGASKSNRKPTDILHNGEQDKITLPPTSSLPIMQDTQDRSKEQLNVDEFVAEAHCGQKTVFSRDVQDESKQDTGNKIPVKMLIQLAANQGGGGSGSTFLLTDLADVQQFFQFPTLRTTTSVSWCFLNYTKPNHSQITPLSSVYGSWCVSSYNPNPLSLSTKATLALLCSRQRKNTETYTTAAMHQLGSGKLVPSLLWKQRFVQLKSEVTQLDSGKYSHQKKCTRENGNDDHGEKEPISKQDEPTRIKIFEGGYKSNEDYVYVRGRGRGKYICEECGIRCKKPSMLKKHIRTHTDVRPYVCKFCNFAFKTKGNLTKHMKSKAHMKKCLELGVSVTCVDDVEAEEADTAEENPQDCGQFGMADHQFSDADDSDGPDDDGDEIDEDEEDEEEYDGDSTPKTCSRSTSPQPHSLALLAATVVTASQGSSGNFLHSGSKSPLFSYLTSLPSIQVTQLRNYMNQLSVPNSMDEDSSLSPEHTPSSFDLSPSCLSSPGCDSSPLREPSPTSQRYLSPKGDFSPRRRLSPRREAYHLRHLSPRRDIFHRDVSPRGDNSPINLLLPISNTGRPTSPGRELSSRRDLSPRSRYRVRPVSPRRGLHHQNSPWSLGQNLQAEFTSLALKTRGPSESETEQIQKMDCDRNSSGKGIATSHHGLFSHLPLHSQQQIHTPFPMIPIGGIQIVHSVRPSITGLTHPAHLSLQKNTSKESNANEVFFQVEDGSVPSGRLDSSQTQGNMLFSPMGKQSQPSVSVLTEKSERDVDEISDKDIKQEESIQTCTKAIASLRIVSEEPLEKSLSTDNPPYQQPSTSSHSPINPEKMASIKIHPSNELDTRQSLNGSAIPLHSSMENVLSYLPLNSKSGEKKLPLLKSHGERLLNTNRVNNCTENE
ncbi:transcription factor HIVEP2a [Alosa sapidissima]|uniref:transcription factor HIVEP2a n=1 Tax=Alosa sapidissima TaxID=34773 RepID=UPI001C09E605|nr:transcription factor HIVEP2a [Alosa sapidissima]XP_041950214.1 transcription factor HIVEP2a [Alosa sapidissima]XP_041950215.1 transcription factor HIVEP2a [Alosa sapidissima]XP_041950216.1 transcription factor HIVEP2a [Alosa sapidissima]